MLELSALFIGVFVGLSSIFASGYSTGRSRSAMVKTEEFRREIALLHEKINAVAVDVGFIRGSREK